ncbi:MAG: trigger factor [Erysipelotrichaceae bacterium]|nr:trigger factor [Erysipelotrichaceae bacterium]
MEKNKNYKHEITIKIEGEEWKKALEEAYLENNKKAKIDGFRPGKAPYDVFVKHYGVESLFMDAADKVLQPAYLKAITDSKLVPVVEPKVDLKGVSEKEVEFVFTIITKPELKIKKYEGLKIKKDKLEVKENEIQDEIDRLLEQYAELVMKEGTVENGDTVIIDYEGSVDGVPFDGGKAQNQSLVIGSKTFIPGFEEQLIGMEKESEKDINVVFPEDYHAENLKGKEAVFKVKVHEIKTKKNRELDDEFFEDLGMEGVNSVETLKDAIKEHLEAHKKTDIENKFVDDMLDAISKETEVDIPEEMVEDEINHLIKRFEDQLKYQGASLDLYYKLTNSTEEALRSQVEKEAFKNVLYRLILEELVKILKIEVSYEEAKEEIKKMAEEYHATEDEILKELGSMDMVKYDIEVKKAFAKLEELNK